jgi:Rps23 Pro-64 3,4-dihydroxylase Tpa1-like proline 4-hydroxylase
MDGLVQINPALDRAALRGEFDGHGRLQVRDVLTPSSAASIQKILTEQTPWGFACQDGARAPARLIRAGQPAEATDEELREMTARAAADGDYGFAYHSYPLVTAYLEQWRPGSPQERLLEELNSPPVLEFMRAITGIGEIVKMDGQATLYAPGHFLRPHNDEESERGRRVAYVLNLTVGEWQPHWGGYLNFFSEDWDIEQAFRPRFNCLNLFRVPQWHSVGEVSAAAPLARYAVTGWARDR